MDLFLKAIYAGIMIAIGGVVNLRVGGVAGAVFFSLGLLTILTFKFNLFTGKMESVIKREVSFGQLTLILIGNLIGVLLVGKLLLLTPIGLNCYELAQPIIASRMANSHWENLVMGIFCGLLMYVAVKGFNKTGHPIFVVFPVAVFILCGFNHCIADAFYCAIGCGDTDFWFSMVGNFIGGAVFPFLDRVVNEIGKKS